MIPYQHDGLALPAQWTCDACGRRVPRLKAGGGDGTWIGHTPGCPDRAAMLAPLPGVMVFVLPAASGGRAG